MLSRRGILVGSGALLASPALAQAPATVAVVLETSAGAITLSLATTAAPLTAGNFLRYVDTRRMDGATFYRAARAKGVEGVGLLEGGLQNDPSKLLPPVAHEPTTLTGLNHKDGAISMAREAPGTATADFFICTGPAPYLDAHAGAPGDSLGYAVFGEVSAGMEVVRAILAGSTNGLARNPVMQGQMLDAPVAILRARRA